MSSKPNKYTPHQGKKERVRRLKHLQRQKADAVMAILDQEPAP